MADSREPEIVINGRRLELREAMTLRVAVQSFAASLQDQDALGDDEHGRGMRAGYLAAIRGINICMAADPKDFPETAAKSDS